nr:hypothetical protein [Oscillospiraceae bacterium]
MAEKKGYEGRIGHSGQQFVEAPFAKKQQQDHSKVHTGKDLRTTAGGKTQK